MGCGDRVKLHGGYFQSNRGVRSRVFLGGGLFQVFGVGSYTGWTRTGRRFAGKSGGQDKFGGV